MRLSRFSMIAAVAAVVSCSSGGDDDPNGPGLLNGTVTATVDGASFNANGSVVASYLEGNFTFGAFQGSGANTKSIAITLTNVTGPGQYNLGLAGNAATYSEIISSTAYSWLCAITQGSGTITFTTLTATKAIGTFSFTAPANTVGPATGTKTVSGSFNINITNPE